MVLFSGWAGCIAFGPNFLVDLKEQSKNCEKNRPIRAIKIFELKK